MEEPEANSTQIGPVLVSEGDNNRLYEKQNQGSEVDGLVKDAADEEEPDLQARIKEAENRVAKSSQDKLKLIENIRERKYDWCCIRSLFDYYRNRHEMALRYCLTLEREKMNILQLFLLRSANKAHLRKPIKPCLSGEEIVKHKLNFRMVDRTNSLAEEKQLLKEINVSQEGGGSFSSLEKEYPFLHDSNWWLCHQMRYKINQRKTVEHRLSEIQDLKWRRAGRLGVRLQRKWDEAIAKASANANAAATAIATGKIWESLGSKKSLLEQIKVTDREIDDLTKLLLSVRPEIKRAEKELKDIEKDIESMKKKLPSMDQKKNEPYIHIHKLRKQYTKPPFTRVTPPNTKPEIH